VEDVLLVLYLVAKFPVVITSRSDAAPARLASIAAAVVALD
jgi:hypothetical protein